MKTKKKNISKGARTIIHPHFLPLGLTEVRAMFYESVGACYARTHQSVKRALTQHLPISACYLNVRHLSYTRANRPTNSAVHPTVRESFEIPQTPSRPFYREVKRICHFLSLLFIFLFVFF